MKKASRTSTRLLEKSDGFKDDFFFIPCGTYLFLEKNTGRQAVFCVTMLGLLYLATSAKCELSRVLSSGQKMRFISAYPTRFMNIFLVFTVWLHFLSSLTLFLFIN